jgi:hypothetical protein
VHSQASHPWQEELPWEWAEALAKPQIPDLGTRPGKEGAFIDEWAPSSV